MPGSNIIPDDEICYFKIVISSVHSGKIVKVPNRIDVSFTLIQKTIINEAELILDDYYFKMRAPSRVRLQHSEEPFWKIFSRRDLTKHVMGTALDPYSVFIEYS